MKYENVNSESEQVAVLNKQPAVAYTAPRSDTRDDAGRKVISKGERIASIETLRVFAAFAVVMIHFSPFQGLIFSSNYAVAVMSATVHTLCRFAVPFFLIISGYFFRKSFENSGGAIETVCWKYMKRLGLIFIIWCIFYAFIPTGFMAAIAEKGVLEGFIKLAYWKCADIFLLRDFTIRELLTRGTQGHLWFISALIQALLIITICVKLNWEKALLPAAALLYVLAMLMVPYAPLPFGIKIHGDFFSVAPLSFAFVFVVLGWLEAKKGVRHRSFSYAMKLIMAGWCIAVIETLVLRAFLGTQALGILVGVLPLSVGMFYLAISRPNLCAGTMISRAGALTLGVYILHVFAGESLAFAKSIDPFLFYPVFVFGVSVLLSWLIKRNVLMHKHGVI